MNTLATTENFPQRTLKGQVLEYEWKELFMDKCNQCEDQSDKTSSGKPHESLVKIDEQRVFKGRNARCFEEQDYQCLNCESKFTWSSNKNDLAWTLWQG